MKFYLSIMIVFLSALSAAQTYKSHYFEHLNNYQGLISDEVNVSYQDANGFMWFGTEEGIVRYDGYEFKSYKNHPYLGFLYGMKIKVITSTPEGKLLIGTSKGFYAFSEHMEPIYTYASEEINGFVNDVYVGSDGIIYVSAFNDFFIIDTLSQKVDIVKDGDIEQSFSQQIAEDSNGRIWVGSWGKGLLQLSQDRKSFKSYLFFKSSRNESSDNCIKSLYIDSNGHLWVGAWESGLYVLDVTSGEEPQVLKVFQHDVNDENSIPGNIVLDIEEDQFNGIWIGTPYGTAVIRYPLAKHSEVIRYSYSSEEGCLSSNVVRDVFCDKSNLLWFATKGGGVNKLYLERNKFDHYIIPDLDPQKRTQSIYAFEKDNKGRLMVGVLSLGFVIYDFEKKKFSSFKELPEFKKLNEDVDLNTVTSFLWDKDSLLWLGTRYNGVVRVDIPNHKVRLINSEIYKNNFKGRNVNVQLLDNDGSVWVGTELGLHHIRYNLNNEPHVSCIKFLDSNSNIIRHTVEITGIVKNKKGQLLISTYLDGLFVLENNKSMYKAVSWPDVVVSDKIVSLFADGGGRIWIGTKGAGVKFIDNNSTDFISPLPNVNIYGDVIFGISQDEYGSMWLTTNKGLLKLWFQHGEVRVERFLHRDGLQGNVFIPHSVFKDAKGELFIGGYNGFNHFNPLKINGNYSKPPIVITDVFVEGERLTSFGENNEILELNHIKNDFSLTFSALDYIYSDANQYAYILEGVDDEWKYVSAKLRSVNYSNLAPGDYLLKVKGSNNQGIWNEECLELPIVVRSAPYKTWWAIVIYVLVVVGIMLLLFYQRLRLERIKQKYQLELLDKEKAEHLHEYKLRFFTNISHELLTPLSILSSVSENSLYRKKYSLSDNLVIQRNVNNLTRMIRQLLIFRKMESGNMSLRLEKGDISRFVSIKANDFKALAEKRSMNFNVKVEPNIFGVFDADKLEIVLHNLLSNAFKYNNDGGTVSCLLCWNEVSESIRIDVEDDGQGISKDVQSKLFNRYYRGDKVESKEGIGIGLNLTSNLIEILHGEISVSSAVNKGATFTVILPVTIESYSDSLQDSGENKKPVHVDNGSEEMDVESDSSCYENIPEGNYTILIAEDNDDFRGVLQNSLSDNFNVLVAVDGKAALKLALDNDIDLIISDVMMPNMSGKELCLKVKSDINLSHIPVILLTAKTGDKNRLAGYEAGADAYLEKPVVLKLLVIRIANLLKSREKFKKKVSSEEVSLEPENISVTPLDQKFIIEAKAVVEKNLSDPDFTVKIMAEELNVTNSMLYRKMRSLAGYSPNEFIRSIRLRRAAQMLSNKGFTISEVAFNCGFNDLGYFGVCFKKEYGKTPTVYQSQGKDS